MDRLMSTEDLNQNDELVSNNGWAKLVLHGDGSLALYRTQVSRQLWSADTGGEPISRVQMQADGNLVALSAQGATVWETGTAGNSGAWVVLQDDGNLVLYDSAKQALWASDTVQDFHTPTISLADDKYSYVEVSESWKELCRELPCFAALQWPGYSTVVLEETIDDELVVIQLWKGWCPQFLGLSFFAGGVGAEVGVYRRIAGAVRLPAMPPLVGPVGAFVRERLANLTDNEFWWPFPELGTELEFTLINRITSEPVFSAGHETSYWLAKWMSLRSYANYWADKTGRIPPCPDAYTLEYTINGQTQRWY